jgi:hypothetical protein
MRQGQFGLMVHWLAPGPAPEFGPQITELDPAVNAFDVDRFLNDYRRTKADWLIFTIGQNTGYYASPNAVFDRLVGSGRCAQRDLVMEIAKGVKELGGRFMAYLPCEISAQSDNIKQAFGWTKEGNTAQEEFQHSYTEFLAEYSLRFGPLLDGWWIDGAFTQPIFHNSHIIGDLWLDAARAGNPNAAVAFNDGSLCCGHSVPVVAGQDYLAGEADLLIKGKIRYGRQKDSPLLEPATHSPIPPHTCSWHCLVPIDCMWAHGWTFADWQNSPYEIAPIAPGEMERPLYPLSDLETLVRDFKEVGGGVTFNVGIFQEGGLGIRTVDQLRELSHLIDRRRATPER